VASVELQVVVKLNIRGRKIQNVIIDTSLIYCTNLHHEGVYVSPSLSISVNILFFPFRKLILNSFYLCWNNYLW